MVKRFSDLGGRGLYPPPDPHVCNMDWDKEHIRNCLSHSCQGACCCHKVP